MYTKSLVTVLKFTTLTPTEILNFCADVEMEILFFADTVLRAAIFAFFAFLLYPSFRTKPIRGKSYVYPNKIFLSKVVVFISFSRA